MQCVSAPLSQLLTFTHRVLIRSWVAPPHILKIEPKLVPIRAKMFGVHLGSPLGTIREPSTLHLNTGASLGTGVPPRHR